jgi:hypothetical protein
MWPIALVAVLGLVSLTAPAIAEVSPEVIEWEVLDGSIVRFHIGWHNLDPLNPSLEFSGQMFSQEFGAFLPHYGLIGNFTVPPIPAESFGDVYLYVPLSSLPLNSGGSPGRELTPDGVIRPPRQCTPLIWSGNVDIVWAGPGGAGQVNKHYGEVGLCPGGEASCIHALTGCNGPLTWAINNPCPGYTVTLLNEDLTPAPGVLPVGWTGWICILASGVVPVGTSCCITVDFTCDGVTVPVQICGYACYCPTPTLQTTWGQVKTIYR